MGRVFHQVRRSRSTRRPVDVTDRAIRSAEAPRYGMMDGRAERGSATSESGRGRPRAELRRPAVRAPRRPAGPHRRRAGQRAAQRARSAPTRTARSATPSPACTSSGSPSWRPSRTGWPSAGSTCATATRRYIGRLGLSDDEQTQLLVDWRAPGAREFYQATAASPGDVVRRRHLATRGRSVIGVEDEALDLDSMDQTQRSSLTGEGALLAAVGAHRTGRMGDIVATIQAEQDQVIRSDLAGPLVVQGGPGTGKTAVALHRAAYLLYTHRERLGRSGVLHRRARTRCSCATSSRCCRRWARPASCCRPRPSSTPGSPAVHEPRADVAALKGDLRMARGAGARGPGPAAGARRRRGCWPWAASGSP